MKKYITGILLLSLFTFISCKKKKDDPTPAPDPNAIVAKYYIQANIDGTTKTFQHNINGYTNGGGGGGTTGSNGNNTYSTVYGKYSIGSGGLTLANDALDIDFNLNSLTPIQSDYDNFFVTGSKTYLANADDLNGVVVNWLDENGNYWSTTNGSQPGTSTFNITGIGSDVINSTNFNWVSATFTCTLWYGSSSKVATGTFKGLILPFQP